VVAMARSLALNAMTMPCRCPYVKGIIE
jgi:hypothetical protein